MIISAEAFKSLKILTSPQTTVITESDYENLTSYEDNTEYHIIEG